MYVAEFYVVITKRYTFQKPLMQNNVLRYTQKLPKVFIATLFYNILHNY
jgi:hypothetical protein